jgi:hypothetical protein
VKNFGQMLQADHTAANEKAIDAAKSMGVAPPDGPNAKQKAVTKKCQKCRGHSSIAISRLIWSPTIRRISQNTRKPQKVPIWLGVREREYPDPTEAPRDRKVVSLKEDLEQIGSVSSPTSRFDLGLGGNASMHQLRIAIDAEKRQRTEVSRPRNVGR